MKKHKYLIGIDEAGRGPLAGPVTVAAVAATVKIKSQISNLKLRDSKKLTVLQREEWAKHICEHPRIFCVSASVSAKVIDKIGITKAVCLAINRCIKKLEKKANVNHKNSFIKLDGLLKVPEKYSQETIIKGDEKIPIISLASIIAKVTRDKKMRQYHKKFPQYDFARHKGYGTKLHYKNLKKHGLCEIHRRSYLTKIIK
jgi:ribonuclease HII